MVAVSACYQKWVRNPTSPESNSPQNLLQMGLHLEKVTHRGVRVWGPIVCDARWMGTVQSRPFRGVVDGHLFVINNNQSIMQSVSW